MKMLFTSSIAPEVVALKGLLEDAGIECEVRNEFMDSTIPGAAFYPELWVARDEDFPRAVELRDAWRSGPSVQPGSWKCPQCGETLEGQFLSCWKCGARRETKS